ncbi:uncharacterized protein LOC142591421 [Dermacentor variabilis]|uniref:uncharacterized protein LOC142591421 n=1 Tax=Dermacentor variabilis TaxID=34621 RepID=UPI003F5B840A
MARSEENTIISPDAEADGNENLPMKVYKPSTWTSQPGARLTKYGQRGQPAAAPLRKQRSDTERSPAAPYVDRLRGSGSYDVDDRFTEYEEGLHKATAVRRKESNAELNSEAQNAYGPSNSGSYDMDAGPTAYGLGGQPATTGPEVRLRNTKRSSPAQLSDRPHSSGTYDVVDDETRKVQDNEVFSDVSSKGFTSNYITAPTSLDSPKKKAYFDIPETEQRGERGDQALWRKLLDATSIRATLPDAPKERRSMPAQGSQGLASIPRSQHMGSSDVTPGPNPEAFSRKACVEDVNDTVMCNEYPKTVLSIEDEAWQPSNDSAPLPPRDPIATHRKPATLVRPVICVLNLGTQELWERYVMTNITVTYCTVVLWESLSLGTPKDHKLGRRGTLAVDKEKFDLMVDHTKQFRTARNGSLLIYVTLGGQRSDSPAYVSMLHSEGWQVSVVVSLRRFNGILHGP